MRHYIKATIISAIAFYAAYSLIPTIRTGGDPKNILFIIGGLLIMSEAVHPIFSLILLPINHLTFGLASTVLNVALIYIFINFLPGFSIAAYNFPGGSINGFILPPTHLSVTASIIVVSAIITFVQKILHIIFE